MAEETGSPSDQMLQMISGFWLSRALYVAAQLGFADHLHDQPRTASKLAETTGTHAASVYRVLRALASVGVFIEDEQGRFSVTPLGATLRSSVPGSQRALAISELGGEHYTAWGDVLHSVQTGSIAFDHVFGTPVWEYYAAHPEEAQVFNDSMTGLTRLVEAAVLDVYDFSPFAKIVDVGGGHGGFLAAILRANPAATGIVFDAPQVIAGAGTHLKVEGVADRCAAIGGDFFQSVPPGGNLYTLKAIIHDWDDERSLAILKNCHRAMAPGTTLSLVDAVIPAGNTPAMGKFIDLIMLVMTGGRERTEEEFRNLLAAAGFTLTRIIPTRSPFSVIEAKRIDN
jgi:O-methyltransferase domain/Dimerisation domain